MKTITTPTKKASNQESLVMSNIVSIKENEKFYIEEFLNDFKNIKNEISLFDLNKLYLINLSLNYDQTWYSGLDEIYLNIFNFVNKQYNLFDALAE